MPFAQNIKTYLDMSKFQLKMNGGGSAHIFGKRLKLTSFFGGGGGVILLLLSGARLTSPWSLHLVKLQGPPQ